MLWPDREGYALICPSGKHLLRNFQSWILCIILFSFLGLYNAWGPGLEDRRVPGRWCPRWPRWAVDDRLVRKQLTGLFRLRLHDKIESSFHPGISIRFFKSCPYIPSSDWNPPSASLHPAWVFASRSLFSSFTSKRSTGMGSATECQIARWENFTRRLWFSRQQGKFQLQFCWGSHQHFFIEITNWQGFSPYILVYNYNQ